MRKEFYVIVKEDAYCINPRFYGKKIKVREFSYDDRDKPLFWEDRYKCLEIYHWWIRKEDCILVPVKNKIGGKIV